MGRARFLAFATFAVLAAPAAARAADPPQAGCPPGAWFCADAPGIHIAPAAPDEDDAATAPPSASPAPPPPSEAPAPARPALRPAPPPPPPVPPPYAREHWAARYEPPPPPPRRDRAQTGFQLRFEGVMLGSSPNRASNAGMGGFGFSLRPRPAPSFAIDLGLDFVGGRDWQGQRRSEAAFLVAPMIFVNPRDTVQLYLLAGLGFSSARVEHPDASVESYGYFGLHGGAGIEIAVAKGTALALDVVGFVRDRTDAGADLHPEFVDASSGRATNASGGGLVRLGVTFYW